MERANYKVIPAEGSSVEESRWGRRGPRADFQRPHWRTPERFLCNRKTTNLLPQNSSISSHLFTLTMPGSCRNRCPDCSGLPVSLPPMCLLRRQGSAFQCRSCEGGVSFPLRGLFQSLFVCFQFLAVSL